MNTQNINNQGHSAEGIEAMAKDLHRVYIEKQILDAVENVVVITSVMEFKNGFRIKFKEEYDNDKRDWFDPRNEFFVKDYKQHIILESKIIALREICEKNYDKYMEYCYKGYRR